MGRKRQRSVASPLLPTRRPASSTTSSSLLLVTLLVLSSSLKGHRALVQPPQQAALAHPSLDNLWYSSPNETAIPTCIKEYGGWAFNRTWSAVSTATSILPGSYAAASVATGLVKPTIQVTHPPPMTALALASVLRERPLDVGCGGGRGHGNGQVAEDVVAYLAMETFDVMVGGSQWLLRTGNYSKARVAHPPTVIIADQSRRLVADVLRHQLERRTTLGSRHTMPAPLQRLLARTLSSRKRNSRPPLFEHLMGLGTSMGLAVWLLRHHPVYLMLSMTSSIYYAWMLQMAYDAVVREGITTALEETLQAHDDFNAYESAMWFNNLLAHSWAHSLGPHLDVLVEKQLDGALKTSILPNISRLEVSEFTFGSKPPRIQYLRLLNSSSADLHYEGLVGDLVPTTEDKPFFLLEIGLSFMSEGSLIKASFEQGRRSLASLIPVPRKRLPALLSISDISIQATLLLLIQFPQHPPFMEVSRWCFAEKPDVQFSLRPLSVVDVRAMPLVSQALEYWINRSLLQPAVHPNFIQV